MDFPIDAVSHHAVRDKSTPPGHPSTLHLWWARRPLASSQVMLLPDPGDRRCLDEFRTQARAALLNLPGRPARWDDELRTDAGLRRALLDFIADFANWDNAAKPAYLAAGRALAQAAHPDETPLVVDPFAGGGSIPLEALRLGCDAFAGDLNPVAGLILKTLPEDIPRRGPELADELRKAGAEIKAQAEAELADLYPPTRTAPRPLPTCGRARCVAKAPTAALKSRCRAPCGCAGSPGANGPCAPTLSGRWGRRPGGVRNLGTGVRPASRRRQRGQCTGHLPGLRNRAAAGDGCGPSWPPSAAAPMRC